ncbi:TPA: glycosyltransferase family 9 protein, partial [Morganella morganii]|nr:glycosyltransferase family 9 protein [Morganella morganii]
MKKKKFTKLRSLNRKRNYMMKNIRYYSRLLIEKILWDKKSKSAIDFSAVKSILILRNEGKIGDVIVDSGVIKVLSQHGYDVDIVVTPDNCSIMQHDKNIRSIYIADKVSLNDFMKNRNHN